MQNALKGAIQGAGKTSSTSIQESDVQATKPEIVVAGVGGGGNNTVDRIASKGIREVEMVAINTDQSHLSRVKTDKKIPIGQKITQGRGTGGYPEVGRRAAKSSTEKFRKIFKGQTLCFWPLD